MNKRLTVYHIAKPQGTSASAVFSIRAACMAEDVIPHILQEPSGHKAIYEINAVKADIIIVDPFTEDLDGPTLLQNLYDRSKINGSFVILRDLNPQRFANKKLPERCYVTGEGATYNEALQSIVREICQEIHPERFNDLTEPTRHSTSELGMR